jgi:hypothetical protein
MKKRKSANSTQNTKRRKEKQEEKPILDDSECIYPNMVWQQELIDRLKQPANDRQVHWYWSKQDGIGKSTLVRHLIRNMGGHEIMGLSRRDVSCQVGSIVKSLKRNDIVIFDIPKEYGLKGKTVDYSVLTYMKDRYVWRGRKEIDLPLMHILVLTYHPPNLEMLTKDRWVVQEIDQIPNYNQFITDSSNAPIHQSIVDPPATMLRMENLTTKDEDMEHFVKDPQPWQQEFLDIINAGVPGIWYMQWYNVVQWSKFLCVKSLVQLNGPHGIYHIRRRIDKYYVNKVQWIHLLDAHSPKEYTKEMNMAREILKLRPKSIIFLGSERPCPRPHEGITFMTISDDGQHLIPATDYETTFAPERPGL